MRDRSKVKKFWDRGACTFAAYEATFISPIVLVRQGSTSGGDNLNLQYVSRITFDANGNIATAYSPSKLENFSFWAGPPAVEGR